MLHVRILSHNFYCLLTVKPQANSLSNGLSVHYDKHTHVCNWTTNTQMLFFFLSSFPKKTVSEEYRCRLAHLLLWLLSCPWKTHCDFSSFRMSCSPSIPDFYYENICEWTVTLFQDPLYDFVLNYRNCSGSCVIR